MEQERLTSVEIFVVDCFWTLLLFYLVYWGMTTNSETAFTAIFFVFWFTVLWLGYIRRQPYINFNNFAPIDDSIYAMGMFFLWLPIITVHYIFKKLS